MTSLQEAITTPAPNPIAPGNTVRLRLRLPAKIDPLRIPEVLGAPELSWLGEKLGEDAGRRQFACDLELRVRPEARATFHKSAIVGLGTPQATAAGWVVPCEWRAAGMAPLFPVFAGWLRFDRDGITIEGFYAPPLGVIGYVLDRALLGMAARGTARWFLRRLAVELA